MSVVTKLTTDKGVSVRVTSGGSPGVNVVSEPVRGTTERSEVRLAFQVVDAAALVSVRVVREPSLRFDKLIRGTLRLDGLSLVRTTDAMASGDSENSPPLASR